MTDPDRSRRPFSKGATAGAGVALAVVAGAIALCGNGIAAFVSAGGLVIVVGGVIAVAFMSFAADDVNAALRAIAGMVREPVPERILRQDMETIIGWAHLVREGGLRHLEARAERDAHEDPLVRYGINMVVSEYSPEDLRGMMETAADVALERAVGPIDVLRAMTSHAPAFGMVGTLIGMVAMLGELGGDPSGVGPALAVSLLSTLYGVVSARMIYMPAACRLTHAVDRRRFRDGLITEGMVMLAERRPPSFIRDRLNAFLAPDAHDYLDTMMPSAATGRPQTAGRFMRDGFPGLRAVSL